MFPYSVSSKRYTDLHHENFFHRTFVMPSSHLQFLSQIALCCMLVVAGLSSCSQFNSANESHPDHAADSDGQHFTRMDVASMREYRDGRRAEFAESLSQSQLSKQHQELLATAMAKTYVGIPVSSYTETNQFVGVDKDVSEETENWKVTDTGYLQGETDSTNLDLRFTAPFFALPLSAYLPETGRLLEESDSKATFEFKIDIGKHDDTIANMIFSLSTNTAWIMQISTIKSTQSPESVILKIQPPTYDSPEPKLEALSLEVRYSYIDSCECFAVTSDSVEIELPEGYEEFVEPGLRSSTATYSNIVCDQPLQYLLPDLEQPLFLDE